MRHDAAVSATRARLVRGMVIARRMGVASVLLGFSACGNSAAGNAPAASPVVVVPVAAPIVDAAPAPAPTPTPAPAPTPTPSPTPSATPSAAPALKGIVAEGDSISVFWGGSYPGIFAHDHPSLQVQGFAVGGAAINDPGGNGLIQRLPKVLAARPALVTVLIGVNDLGGKRVPTVGMWLDQLWSYVAALKASGAKVVVGTVLPICMPQYAEYNESHKERRAIVNPEIRAAVGTKIDGVFDIAADPTVGPDAAACDKTIYSDGIHPEAKGQLAIAKVYTRAVEAVLGR